MSDERDDEFVHALARRMLDAELKSPALVAQSIRGYTLRQHVREAHAGQERYVADVAAPASEPERAAWLFGYHFGDGN